MGRGDFQLISGWDFDVHPWPNRCFPRSWWFELSEWRISSFLVLFNRHRSRINQNTCSSLFEVMIVDLCRRREVCTAPFVTCRATWSMLQWEIEREWWDSRQAIIDWLRSTTDYIDGDCCEWCGIKRFELPVRGLTRGREDNQLEGPVTITTLSSLSTLFTHLTIHSFIFRPWSSISFESRLRLIPLPPSLSSNGSLLCTHLSMVCSYWSPFLPFFWSLSSMFC